jgi:Tfp pilus assembly protein PilO
LMLVKVMVMVMVLVMVMVMVMVMVTHLLEGQQGQCKLDEQNSDGLRSELPR